MDSPRIHPETRIGCVHLKVAHIERSLGGSYRDILGSEVTQWYGEDAISLTAGGYHPYVSLNTSAGRNVPPAARNSAGLYPERPELARALRELLDAEYPLDGASDYGVSEALYLCDSDDNRMELYWDRPREAWPHDGEGNPTMGTQPLGVRGLLAELDGVACGR